MPMNLDAIKQRNAELAKQIMQAVKDGNEEGVAQAFAGYQQFITEQSGQDMSILMSQMDNQVLSSRGARAMTSEEKEYFEGLKQAMISSNPKQALTDLPKAMPVSVVDTVMDELQQEYPLLDEIDFVPTTGMTKLLYSEDGTPLATWDDLSTAIATELSKTIKDLDMTACKLSAMLPVPKDMIDLSASWLLNLIVALLKEANYAGLSKAVVKGTGKKQPIGMMKNLSGAVVDGVYPDKTAEVITEINPITYNALVAKVAKKPNGKSRTVPYVIFIVNPIDYLTKVLPATTILKADGTYNTEVFPFPTKVIQCEELDEGEAILGIGKRYLLGLAGDSKDGTITYDDSVQFTDDKRVYLIKTKANGRPKDNGAFIKVDISGLKARNLKVQVINDDSSPVPTVTTVINEASSPVLTNEVDATLKSLKIGALSLTPTFAAGTKEYTCATTAATNTITVVTNSSTAEVTIMNGETAVANGAPATWADGANTVTITVTDGNDTETYTVTVTKS